MGDLAFTSTAESIRGEAEQTYDGRSLSSRPRPVLPESEPAPFRGWQGLIRQQRVLLSI